MSKHPTPSQPHPMQPIIMSRRNHDGPGGSRGDDGVVRFQQNSIVRWLLDEAGKGRHVDLNRIAMEEFDDEDKRQFAQLIGYSVSGWGDLSYVQTDRAALDKADRIAAKVVALDKSPNGISATEEVDIDGLATGILHTMVLSAVDTRFTEIAEWPMPQVDEEVNHTSGNTDPSFVIRLATFAPTTDHDDLSVTLERRAPRNLSPQDRYEVLERLLDLLSVEVAKAKQDAVSST